MLLSARQARALLDDADSPVAVIDARGPLRWAAGHLPHARPLHWRSLTDAGLSPLPPRDGRLSSDDTLLRSRLWEAGVRDHLPVLLYDKGPTGMGEAGRLLWTLHHLAPRVPTVLLDGGLPCWDGPLHRLPTTPPLPGGSLTLLRAPRLRATLPEVEAALTDPAVTLWDTRSAAEFAGATPHREARGGHIPGAVSLPFPDLFDAQGCLLDPPRLEAALAAAGLHRAQRIIALCTGGIRSGLAYAALHHLGWPDVANYDGSMWEWAADPRLPLVGHPEAPLLAR